jgi:glucokinase
MAKGGVYVGGGIAPKIVDKLRGPGFREAFAAKGRMRYFMEAIPVYVILTNRAALIGAAEFARLQS